MGFGLSDRMGGTDVPAARSAVWPFLNRINGIVSTVFKLNVSLFGCKLRTKDGKCDAASHASDCGSDSDKGQTFSFLCVGLTIQLLKASAWWSYWLCELRKVRMKILKKTSEKHRIFNNKWVMLLMKQNRTKRIERYKKHALLMKFSPCRLSKGLRTSETLMEEVVHRSSFERTLLFLQNFSNSHKT